MRDVVLSKVQEVVPGSFRDQVEVSVSESVEHGHYSTNVAFLIAKEEKKSPSDVARVLAKKIEEADSKNVFEKVDTAGAGFINFFLSKELLGETVKEILKKGEKFGQGRKKKETIVIEYSSPNIAKPLGVHHLRSTIIGQALVDILRFEGYKVVSLSFPGDWGTQFGLLIAGYKQWGDEKKIKAHPIDEMLRLYVKFSAAAKKNPKLLDEGRAEFKKLEDGDKENLKLWKWFLDESLQDFEKVYEFLGMKIENTIGESYYEKELDGIVEDALKKGIAKKGDDESVVVSIPDSKTPEIIRKSDGATIYTTREVAAIRHRLKKWKADKILYVAANQQTFHLAQVFRVAELMGIARAKQLGHVKFGMMFGPGGKKFATREGRLIPLIDVLEDAVGRSRKVVDELNPKLSDSKKDEVAHAVGVGAVKFFDLSQNRKSDIIFEWDKALSLKGSTAPYIQYTYARLKSILRKAGGGAKKFDISLLKEPSEEFLIAQLLHFSEVVETAGNRYEPHIIAEYLLRLSEKINTFYQAVPVLKAGGVLQESRLSLILASTIILKKGLNLLGIEAPEEM
tara:strand:- start:2870 stop:4570 length:1701 start_codon:yes stop_codon:yes gene_type:complete